MVLGVTHRDLALEDLQRLSAGAQNLGPSLVGDGPIAGAIVLATCNRVEIYVDARLFHQAVETVIAELAAASGVDTAEVSKRLKVRVGAPAVAHLFTVAAGLDSMVIGEAEISGQVSKSLRRAQSDEIASPALNSLFQSASRVAKRVSSGTPLGAAGRSIASVALDVAESQDGSLAGKQALIIGTGSYARVVASALRARGCTDLKVFSLSERAQAFAATHSARPVEALELPAVLAAVDLAVACSGTTGGALSPQMFAAGHRTRPLTVIDLALRPDISAQVRALPGVHVIDLLTVADNAPVEQSDAVSSAQDMVIAAVAEFEDNQAVRASDPAVIALRSHVNAMVEKEMLRLRGKYDESIAAELELAIHRVTRSLLHTPTMRAQELARSGDFAGYLAALHMLFGIELTSN